MPRDRKIKFFNLAEQLAMQNDVVNNTMDSIISTAVHSNNADERSDWDEIQKTLDKMHELNGPAASSSSKPAMPAPKSINRPSRTSETNRT